MIVLFFVFILSSLFYLLPDNGIYPPLRGAGFACSALGVTGDAVGLTGLL